VKKPIKLHETVHVGRVETLEDVLALLESLDNLGEALKPLHLRIRKMRTRETEEPKRAQERRRMSA
jgi:hypothetical protein